MRTTNFYKSLSKIFCCKLTVVCQKYAQYIPILYPGRFILVESVYKALLETFRAEQSFDFGHFLQKLMKQMDKQGVELA